MDKDTTEKNNESNKLKGCYLLVILSSPKSRQDKEEIIQRVAKDLLSWNTTKTNCDLKELQNFWNDLSNKKEVETNESDMLVQYSNAQMAIEILYNPQLYTVKQCLRNLFQSFTAHKQIIFSGYTYSGSGTWILNDNTFSASDFIEQFNKSQSSLLNLSINQSPGYSHTIHLHCKGVGDWTQLEKQLNKYESCYTFKLNPSSSDGVPGAADLIDFLQENVHIQADTLECSEIVGNIRFTRPTLYIIPSGQGDSLVVGINGFTMLIDGGFNSSPNSWAFIKHLEKIDSILITRFNENNCLGLQTLFDKLCSDECSAPRIGSILGNMPDIKKLTLANEEGKQKREHNLEIDLVESGQNLIRKIDRAGLPAPKPLLRPQDVRKQFEAIELYHRIGFGTLKLYVFNPLEDSKLLREYLEQFNEKNREIFSSVRMQASGGRNNLLKNLEPVSLSNLSSIALVLAWLPAELEEKIVRLLLPGSTPTHKLMEIFCKLQTKHPNTELSILLSHESLTRSEFDKLVSELKPKQVKISLTDHLKSTAENESTTQQLKGKLKSSQRNRSVSPAVRMQQEKSTPQFYDSLETLTTTKQPTKNLTAAVNKKLLQSKSLNADKSVALVKKSTLKPIARTTIKPTVAKNKASSSVKQTSAKTDSQQAAMNAKEGQALHKKPLTQQNEIKKSKLLGSSHLEYTSGSKAKSLASMSEASSSATNLTLTNTIKAYLRDEYEADSLEFLNSAQSTTLSKDSLEVASESGVLSRKPKDDDEDSLDELNTKSYSAAGVNEHSIWDIAQRKNSKKDSTLSPVEKQRNDAYLSEDDQFVEGPIAENAIMNQSTLSTSTVIDNSDAYKSKTEIETSHHLDISENTADSDQEYKEEDAEVQKIFESEKGLKRKILVLENNISKEEEKSRDEVGDINQMTEGNSPTLSIQPASEVEKDFKLLEKIKVESIAVINKMKTENELKNLSAIATKISTKQMDESLIVDDINNNNSLLNQKLVDQQIDDDEKKKTIINSNANVPDVPKDFVHSPDKFVVNEDNLQEVPIAKDENVFKIESAQQKDKKLVQTVDPSKENKDLVDKIDLENDDSSIDSSEVKFISKDLPSAAKNADFVTINTIKSTEGTKNLSRKSSEDMPNQQVNKVHELESKPDSEDENTDTTPINDEAKEEVIIPKKDVTRTGTPIDELIDDKQSPTTDESHVGNIRRSHNDGSAENKEFRKMSESESSLANEKISERKSSVASGTGKDLLIEESEKENKINSSEESDHAGLLKKSNSIESNESRQNSLSRKSSISSAKSSDNQIDSLNKSIDEVDERKQSVKSQVMDRIPCQNDEIESRKLESADAAIKATNETQELDDITSIETNDTRKPSLADETIIAEKVESSVEIIQSNGKKHGSINASTEKIETEKFINIKHDSNKIDVNSFDQENLRRISREGQKNLIFSNLKDEFSGEPETPLSDKRNDLINELEVFATKMADKEADKKSEDETRKPSICESSEKEEIEVRDNIKLSISSDKDRCNEDTIIEEKKIIIVETEPVKSIKSDEIAEHEPNLSSLRGDFNIDLKSETCPKETEIEKTRKPSVTSITSLEKIDESRIKNLEDINSNVDSKLEACADNFSEQKPSRLSGHEIEASKKSSLKSDEVFNQLSNSDNSCQTSPEKIRSAPQKNDLKDELISANQFGSNQRVDKFTISPKEGRFSEDGNDLSKSFKEALEISMEQISEPSSIEIFEDFSEDPEKETADINNSSHLTDDIESDETRRKSSVSSVKSTKSIITGPSIFKDESVAECSDSEDQESNDQQINLPEFIDEITLNKLSSTNIEACLTEKLVKSIDKIVTINESKLSDTEQNETVQKMATDVVRAVINESIQVSEKIGNEKTLEVDKDTIAQERAIHPALSSCQEIAIPTANSSSGDFESSENLKQISEHKMCDLKLAALEKEKISSDSGENLSEEELSSVGETLSKLNESDFSNKKSTAQIETQRENMKSGNTSFAKTDDSDSDKKGTKEYNSSRKSTVSTQTKEHSESKESFTLDLNKLSHFEETNLSDGQIRKEEKNIPILIAKVNENLLNNQQTEQSIRKDSSLGLQIEMSDESGAKESKPIELNKAEAIDEAQNSKRIVKTAEGTNSICSKKDNEIQNLHYKSVTISQQPGDNKFKGQSNMKEQEKIDADKEFSDSVGETTFETGLKSFSASIDVKKEHRKNLMSESFGETQGELDNHSINTNLLESSNESDRVDSKTSQSITDKQQFENLVKEKLTGLDINIDLNVDQLSKDIKQDKAIDDKKNGEQKKSNFGICVQSASSVSDVACREGSKLHESKVSKVEQSLLDLKSIKQIENYSQELIQKANEFIYNLKEDDKFLEPDSVDEVESKSDRSDSGFEFITNISGMNRRHSHSTSSQHNPNHEDSLVRRASVSLNATDERPVISTSTLDAKDESSNRSSRNSLISASLIEVATLNSAIVTKSSLTSEHEKDIFELLNDGKSERTKSISRQNEKEPAAKESPSSEDSEYEKIDMKEVQSIQDIEEQTDIGKSINFSPKDSSKEKLSSIVSENPSVTLITTTQSSLAETGLDTTSNSNIPSLSVSSSVVKDSTMNDELKKKETAEIEVSSWSSLGLPPPSSDSEQLVLKSKPLKRPSPSEASIDDKNVAKPFKQATSGMKSGVASVSNRQTGSSAINNLENDQQMLTANIANDSAVTLLKPFHFDLIYVPHHGEHTYNHLEFFKKCPTDHYVLSSSNPSRETLDLILEARKQFNSEARKKNKNYTPTMINIIPTHESESLFYWISDRQKELEQEAIEVAPSANRCTVQMQNHETEVCSAYRIQF